MQCTTADIVFPFSLPLCFVGARVPPTRGLERSSFGSRKTIPSHKKCPFLSPTPFPILTSFPFNFIQQWVVSSPWLNNRFPRNPSGGPTTYRTSRARSPSSPVSWRMLDVGRESVKAKHPIFGRRECGRRERNREGAFVSLLPVDPPCSPRRVVDKD